MGHLKDVPLPNRLPRMSQFVARLVEQPKKRGFGPISADKYADLSEF
jgi:hypothetical protein